MPNTNNHPDRIDFLKLSDGRVVILKLRRDATDPAAPRDIPIIGGHDIKADFNLDAALAWCTANGYSVRRWPGGARAWKGVPWVIRTACQIIRMRRENSCKVSLDFAYDG